MRARICSFNCTIDDAATALLALERFDCVQPGSVKITTFGVAYVIEHDDPGCQDEVIRRELQRCISLHDTKARTMRAMGFGDE